MSLQRRRQGCRLTAPLLVRSASMADVVKGLD